MTKSHRVGYLLCILFAGNGALSAATQTIVFDSIPNQIFGVSPFPMAAKASSGLPVTFNSTTPAVCKTAANLVTLLSAGPCFITASQPGNGSFSAATPVIRSFTVTQAKPAGTLIEPAGSPFAAGTGPSDMAVGDFNGDGIPDLAVTHFGYRNGGILLGNGSGGFSLAAGGSVTTGFEPVSVAVGDFNGDGNQDLAIANEGDNNITVVLGNGAGGFTPDAGSPFTTGSQPVSIAVGDFNGDGIQDLVAANQVGNSITVLLGNGSGGFNSATGSPFAVGSSPASVAVADFNGDGIQDLAVANLGSNNVTVLLGKGTGGFSTSTFAVGTDPFCVVSGDFNRDGIQDLATADWASGDLTVLLGNGLGGFSPAPGSPFTGVASPQSVVVGDLNGDGIPDLATVDSGYRNVTVSLGNGSGGFTTTVNDSFAVGSSARLVVSDFNQDGIEDLATANISENNVTVLLGTVSGLISQTIIFGALTNLPLGAAPFALAATATSGLTVRFSSSTPAYCTVFASTVTVLNAGTCTIVARQQGDATYAPAPIVIQSFGVLLTQSITFGGLADRLLTAGTFPLTAIATSGLAVSYTSNTASICTVLGSTVTLVKYGTCSITAGQAGDSTYFAATQVTQAFQVTSGIPTPSIVSVTPNAVLIPTAATPITIAGTNFQSGATVSFTPPGGSVQTITPSLIQAAQIAATIPAAYLTTAGTAQIAVSNGSAEVSGTLPFTISATLLTQTITFSSQLGSGSHLTATASSGLTVSFTSGSPSVCTVSGSTLTFLANGTCVVTATQAGGGIYAAAPAVAQAFFQGSNTGPVSQCTANANAIFIRTEGQNEQVADLTLSCNTGGPGTMTLTIYLSPSVTITSGAVATNSGTVSETVAGLGTQSGAPANVVHGTVSGNSVTFTGIQTGPGPFNVTISNIKVNASQVASASGVPTAISETIFMSGINVTPSVLNAVNVAFAVNGLAGVQASGALSYPVCSPISTVIPAFSVQFSEGFPTAFRAQGSAAANSTLDSWLTNGTETGYGVIGNGSNTATSGTRVKIVFSNIPAGASIYVPSTLANNGGTMTLTASETGAFSAVASSTAQGAPANSAALPVTSGSAVAIYEETVASPLSTETYIVPVYLVAPAGTISASTPAVTATVTFAPINASAGNAPNFVSANSSTTVTGAAFAGCGTGTPQAITFAQPPTSPLTAGSIALSATASSGLPVTFASTTSGTCAAIGTNASLISAGTCSITATQPGDSTYSAALPVIRFFTVTPTNAQTINFGPLNNVAMGTAPFSIGASATSGLSVSFTSNTLPVCTVSGNTVTLIGTGTCSITANQAGNGAYVAATPVTQSFSVVVNSGPATCTAAASAVFVRTEGTNEQLPDMTLSCTGGNALPIDITVYLSPAASIASAMVGGVSEALAGLGSNGQALAPGAVNGVPSGSNVTFTNVPTTTGPFTLMITNIRINASQIVTSSGVPTAISVTIFLRGSAVVPTVLNPVNVAYATSGLANVRATGIGSTLVCAGLTAAAPNFSVQFGEGFANAFRVQGSAAANSTLGSPLLNNSETGYGVSVAGATNTASAGTRVKVAFRNIPANAALYVPLTVAGNGGTMTLTATEAGVFSALPASTAPGAPPGSAALTVSGGNATAIYEETIQSGNAIETYSAPVYLIAAAGAISIPTASITATVTLAPIGAAGSVPGFVSGSSTATVTGSTFIACGTHAGTQTISFAPLSNTVSGNVTLTASATSGLPITFTSTTPGSCTVSGNVTTIAGNGQCSITASQPGDADYAAATPITQSFLAGSGNSQTLTVPVPGTQANGTAFAPAATASSGLPVTLTSSTLSICTVSGANVSLIAAGTCTITASQNGNASYAAAPLVTRSFSVVNATGFSPTSCTAAANGVFVRAEGRTEQVADTVLTCTAGNGLPINLQVYLSPAVSVTSANVGTAGSEALAAFVQQGATLSTVSGTVSGSSITFNGVPTSSAPFTITITNIRINATQLGYSGGTPSVVTETIFIGGIGATPNVLPAVSVGYVIAGLSGATATGATVFPVCAAISASNPAFSVHFSENFATAFRPQGLATMNSTLGSGFAYGTETGYGVTSGTASNTATSGTRVKIAFQNVPAGVTLSVPVSISNNGGTMTLTASETGPFSAVPASGINGAALTVVSNSAIAIYETTIGSVSTVESYTVPVYLSAGAGSVASQVSGITATVSFAPIEASGNVPNFSSIASTVTVNGARFSGCGSTIVFPQPANAEFSSLTVSLTASSSSGLPVTYASITPSVCTVTNSSVSLVSAGTCSITASQAAGAYYAAAADVTQSFLIAPAPQSIAFGSIGNLPYNSATIALSAIATSGLTVSFASSTPTVCTVSGANARFVATGLCTLVASQAGDDRYLAAPNAQQSFTVSQVSQTIAFNTLAALTLPASPFALTATATSGLPVAFASTTGGICTVSGVSVTALAPGTCSITATQAGNNIYLAATPVTQTFTINQIQSPTVTLSLGDGNGFAGDTVEIPIQVTSAGTPALTTFQFDLNVDPQKLTFKSARLGAQLTAAGKSISTSVQPNGDVRLLAAGFNQNVIANGIVAYASFTLGTPYSAAAVTPNSCTSADAQGTIVATACTAGTIRLPPCDINTDGSANVADVQLIINEALGVSPPTHDLNHDGTVNVADVQKVINSALGLGCSAQ